MSYSRILWCLRAESLSLRRKPRRLKQFTELFLRAAFRFRKRKRKIGASGRNRTTDTGIFSPLLYRLSYLGMVGLAGLEPATSRLSGVRSNHLSYKP